MSFAEFIMTAFQGVGEAAVGNAVERLERKAKRDAEQEELRASAARHSAPSAPRWPPYSGDMIADLIRHVHDGVTDVMVHRSATERQALFRVQIGCLLEHRNPRDGEGRRCHCSLCQEISAAVRRKMKRLGWRKPQRVTARCTAGKA